MVRKWKTLIITITMVKTNLYNFEIIYRTVNVYNRLIFRMFTI